MSTLDELLERRRAGEAVPVCHSLTKYKKTETLTLEWRSGKRHLLQWSRFTELIFEGGTLSLIFADREVILRGVNLAQLWIPIKNTELQRVWEFPTGSEPPQDPNATVVFEIEVRRGDSWPGAVDDISLSKGTCGVIPPRIRPRVF